jgi:ketosteroid isomerase-like protein
MLVLVLRSKDANGCTGAARSRERQPRAFGAAFGIRISRRLLSGILRRVSTQDVELFRLSLDAWNRGDIDAFLAACHPEFEWHSGGGFPGLDPVYRGHEGFRKFERDFRDTWESLTITLEEVCDAGERVAARGTFHARGRDGLNVKSAIAWVGTFRDGLLMRTDVYDDWSAALEAVG